MDLFELGRLLHSAIGTIALAAFWTAALASKGGRIHQKAGTVYLVSLIGVMSMSTLMVAGQALAGDIGTAVFFVFLISMVGTASWLTSFSFQYRRNPDRLLGPVYHGLASWLVISGLALFGLGSSRGRPLMMFLALLGLGFGANMWRLSMQPGRDGRWWVSHHMNGAMLNFVATHDSFTALGIGSVVPELRQPVPRMIIAVGVTAIALTLRIRLARRRRPRQSAIASPRATGVVS